MEIAISEPPEAPDDRRRVGSPAPPARYPPGRRAQKNRRAQKLVRPCSRCSNGDVLSNARGWLAPNITNDKRRGLGGWSADDIAEYLKTGHNRISASTGLMSETIALSTSRMTDADLHAIGVYLKDQPGQGDKEEKAEKAPDANMMKLGGRIYADECSACHASNGQGAPGLFPALAGSAAVQQVDATSLTRVTLRGARSSGTDRAPTAPAMPAFGWLLSDDEVAAVLTYVRNSWGNAAPPLTASDVSKLRRDVAQRPD
jgi:mono/diheme cytochrome c family protein